MKPQGNLDKVLCVISDVKKTSSTNADPATQMRGGHETDVTWGDSSSSQSQSNSGPPYCPDCQASFQSQQAMGQPITRSMWPGCQGGREGAAQWHVRISVPR